MSLEQLQDTENDLAGLIGSFFPQYAVLLTVFVAVVLFIAKEVMEVIRRRKDRKSSHDAIDRIASIQGIAAHEQLLFLLKLANRVKLTSIFKSHIDSSSVIKVIQIDGEEIRVPASLTKFTYELMLNVAKVSSAKFALYANLNDCNEQLNAIISRVLFDVKNKDNANIIDTFSIRDDIKNMVNGTLEITSSVDSSMKKNKSYSVLMAELYKEMNKL